MKVVKTPRIFGRDLFTDPAAARRRGGRRLGPEWERDEVALDREDALGEGHRDQVDDLVAMALMEATS
jgi:hypothetical protein